nr:MAG TPA: hypothetical protein [Bacteriophage sp.]
MHNFIKEWVFVVVYSICASWYIVVPTIAPKRRCSIRERIAFLWVIYQPLVVSFLTIRYIIIIYTNIVIMVHYNSTV